MLTNRSKSIIIFLSAFLVFGSYLGGDIQQGLCSGNNYSTVDQSGTPLTPRPTLNFTGAGVSCVDNSGSTRTDCTITGTGSGVASVNGATGTVVTGGVMGLCSSASASTTTYTCSLSPNTLQAYVSGQRYTFQPDLQNTGAATVNIDGKGAIPIVMYDGSTALIAADLAAGGFYDLEYNGTSMVKMNGPPTAWTGFSYSNGWGDFGSNFQTGQYHKDNWGNVTLRGVLADGTQTSGTVIFTLPAGFRPVTANGTIISCLQGNSGVTRINVTQSGQVSLGSTVSGTFVSVEGTQFNADF